MDQSDWRHTQDANGVGGDTTMESGDWRAQIQRQRIVNKIKDTLKMHLPSFSRHEQLQELKKIAERVEREIYTDGTSQSEYARKICFMMLSMETRLQNPNIDTMRLDSTAQTGNQNGGSWQDEVYQKIKDLSLQLDWQEEVYQKIKAMKDLYLLDLNVMHQKIIFKMQQHDSPPQQPKNEQFEKLKVFKNMLERFMQFLQIPKHGIQANYKDKLGTYEKQIINVINSNRRKPVPPQQQAQAQALPPPHMQSLQQSQQTHSQLTQVQSHMQSWQEEVYQKIKAMKDLYLLDLSDMHQKVLSKLRQHDSLPQQPKNELFEKLKVFKNMLERCMEFLQIPENRILANHKDKLDAYEKQIINIINSNGRKQAPPQQQAQALPPHMQSLQQSEQAHSQLTQV